jgi:hypothetical protein
MQLNLQTDRKKIRRYVEQRIRDYPDYVNEGPGDDEAPISLITAAYYAAQSGYFILVFDTRPNADPDGEWTLHHAETTMLNFPKWATVYDAVVDGKRRRSEPTTVRRLSRKTMTLILT